MTTSSPLEAAKATEIYQDVLLSAIHTSHHTTSDTGCGRRTTTSSTSRLRSTRSFCGTYGFGGPNVLSGADGAERLLDQKVAVRLPRPSTDMIGYDE